MMPDYCNGPGHKVIFWTRAEAKAALAKQVPGRKARPGQGNVQSCAWAMGTHWHITSRKRPFGGGRH